MRKLKQQIKLNQVMSLSDLALILSSVYAASEVGKGIQFEKDSIYNLIIDKVPEDFRYMIKQGYEGKICLLNNLASFIETEKYINLTMAFPRDKRTGKICVMIGFWFLGDRGITKTVKDIIPFSIGFHLNEEAEKLLKSNGNEIDIPSNLLTKNTIRLIVGTSRLAGSYRIENLYKDSIHKSTEEQQDTYYLLMIQLIDIAKKNLKKINERNKKVIENILTIKSWNIENEYSRSLKK